MTDEGRAVAVLPRDDDDEVAIASVLARVENGTAEVAPGDAPRLVAWLAHPRRALRRRAAGALAAALGRGDVAPAVCEELLTSDDETRRFGAAFALARAGRRSPGVIEAALVALGAADGDVRWAAAAIVVAEARESAELRGRMAGLAQNGSRAMRKMALLCLCDSGERDAAVYLAGLGDADALVRLAALTSLARNGDRSPASLTAISAAAESDDAAAVRRAAAGVLRRLTPTR